MKKTYYVLSFGLLILLLIINLINIQRVQKYKKEYSELLQGSYHKFIEDSILINNLSDNILLTSKNSNFLIPNGIELITEDGTKTFLNELSFSKYLLVFRFNEFTCMDCVYKEMGNIEDIANEIGKNNILILGAYKSRNHLFMNKRVNNLIAPVYNLPLNGLNNSIENYNVPYIFIINKNLQVQNLFIPTKDLPNLSVKYFKSIKELFKN